MFGGWGLIGFWEELFIVLENVVGKVVAEVGLYGGCEMLQEAGDGEVEGELAGNLFGFTEPPVVAAGIGIEDDFFAAEDSWFFDIEAVEVFG